ncbi:MAG TPA: redoxin domain-containing protein [Gemmatimonadales bacterium]|jgi:peroxiredoxin Q/BCP|nr:redoxin domain-containing protein [Gemmatimonadales bacterium]
MRIRSLLAVAALVPFTLSAQGSAPAAMPKVGDMAPNFTLTAATVNGISAKPVTLSSLHGKTVVLAFFPKQRSSGCTIQMKAYRDKYDSVFGGGKHVALFAISVDSAKDLASWAQQEKFPFTFLSDAGPHTAGHLYATLGSRPYENRVVFVIAPNGKISSVMNPFNEVDPTQYTALHDAIEAANKQTR